MSKGKGEGWDAVGIAYTFLSFSVKRCKYGKRGDHQRKKLFIDNAVQALIPFKEGDGSALKLHIHWGREFGCWKKKERIFFEVEEKCMGRLFRMC